MSDLLLQALEVAAAIMILAAFALNQFRGLDRHAMPYLLLNLGGSVILAALAWDDRQWGFLLLQAAWGLVSLWGIVGRLRRRGIAS